MSSEHISASSVIPSASAFTDISAHGASSAGSPAELAHPATPRDAHAAASAAIFHVSLIWISPISIAASPPRWIGADHERA
jgi:hypothetical protein